MKYLMPAAVPMPLISAGMSLRWKEVLAN